MRLPRIMLAAPASGSGKTMITCGILQALKTRGDCPASFKCGPDYIDPMFHAQVIGTASRNLDPYFTDRKTTRHLFARSAAAAGISVMEGVMGLYDGLGGITPAASSYDLASMTETPVVLVVNAKGMSLSVVPFLKGFADYEQTALENLAKKEKEERIQNGFQIRGVILNRITEMTYRMLKPVIEEQTGLRVFGYVPVLDACRVESRHLGLVTPGEIADLQERICELAKELKKTVDLDGLKELAHSAPDYDDSELELPVAVQQNKSAPEIKGREGAGPVIAVARDEAFCFYYQDNLELLKLLGARLVEFSPLHDGKPPQGISGMLFGGGYPELYARALSENTAMREAVRTALSSGMPYLAECGGFMYLQEKMQDMEGNSYPMAGVIEGESYRTKRLGRFGYIELTPGENQLLGEGTIRGHEFHYFDSTDPGNSYSAKKPVTGREWQCIHGTKNSAAGYPHLYYWSNPRFAAQFLRQAERYGFWQRAKDNN